MTDRTIFFDEAKHKYTDEFHNPYTSATQVIDKYCKKFNSKKMAKVCAAAGRRGNPKYAGKTEKQILDQWNKLTVKGQDGGNVKHDYFDGTIKLANGYQRNSKGFINGKIYTIGNILKDHNFGKVDLSVFKHLKLDVKYPKIYQVLEIYARKGWSIYSEIGTFNYEHLISGLIDVLLVKGNKFVIIDWKTNKDPISRYSGYYQKDFDGNITGDFIRTNELFFFPINNLETSTFNKYALQLGVYDYMTTQFGLTCETRLLFHIRTVNRKDIVEAHPMPDMKYEVERLFKHHTANSRRNGQYEATLW